MERINSYNTMVRLPSFMISVLVWSACVIAVDASSCGDTFKSNYGEINSSNYSSNNGYNLSCVWRIEGATDSRIVIGFKNFSLGNQTGCAEKYIEIRHGNGSSSKYCGSKIPEKVTTQRQNASIVFVTNHYTNLSGFHLYWKVFTKPVLMTSPVSWESANEECERIGGKLMEPDFDFLDTYREIIIEWMGAHNVSEIWVRKYFTPWVFLKGCTSGFYVHPKIAYTVKNNQQKICQNLCSGYNYFGLQKQKCVCLNEFLDVLSPIWPSCSYRCDGNTDEKCGESNAYTVYKNNFCYTSSESWNGTLNKNIYGPSCLPWNQTIYKNSTFPDGSANDAKDNCRDPDGYGTPWCYSINAKRFRCDVFKCLDITEKENGSSGCIAVTKNSQGMTEPQQLIGQQMPCSTNLSGIYMRFEPNFEMKFYETAGTWTDVRNNAEQFSFKFPLSTVFENIYDQYKGLFHWTGLSRNTSSLRPLATPSECFKLQRREQTLHEKSETCNLKLPLFCQKGPVNCGESLMQTELSLNYTIDSGSNDMNCIWRIEGFDNTVIRIDISFNIEECPHCECDSLKIYDAPFAMGPPNKTVCGSDQVTFNSTQKALTLAYTSDRSEQGTGFQAKWTFVSLPSKSTTSRPADSTTKSGTGSEDVSPFSSGLIGGIIAAVVVITASIIVFVVIIRRRKQERNVRRQASVQQ
ncbi:hypothetical protein DPMN_130045 [Dreissena polymorpha]|uniref:Kringle-containing protein marking the eye and the nose n=1 Tax=Dreissena polymorpha TaxID=45954 RepID=A0A9D4JYT8_DREPO|nr:hypothetical protein DPMN_130045 [Dreissena polymorpha]